MPDTSPLPVTTGKFDGPGYLFLNPEAAVMGPWTHYKDSGHDDHKTMSVIDENGTSIAGYFDPQGYVSQYKDLVDAKVEGWAHYRDFGYGEGRNAAVSWSDSTVNGIPALPPEQTMKLPTIDGLDTSMFL